jgi:phage host-nuclease inhibitor protein Gam
MTEAERLAALEAIKNQATEPGSTQDRINAFVRQLESMDRQITRLQERKTQIEDELLALSAS